MNTTTEIVRAELADLAREEVLEAVASLMQEIHDIDFHHHDGMAGLSWTDHLPLNQLTADALHLTDRVLAAGTDTRTAIAQALGRRDWLTSGRPLRCAGCGDDVDPTTDPWRVCRGAAEHDVCHLDDGDLEDRDRVWSLGEDEEAAYCEDRAGSGGPRDGDSVEATYPGGCTATGVWEVGPDGAGCARTSGIYFSDARPADPGEVPEFLDLAAAIGVRVVWAAGPHDHPGPAIAAISQPAASAPTDHTK